MKRIANTFLAMPLFILGAVFLIDKLFYLRSVREYTEPWQKVEPPFYESRVHLFEQLRRDHPGRTAGGYQLGVIFGTSRAGEFNNQDIQKIIPRSYTYNFSAPFACPSFHYYWLERMLREGIRPQFVLLEADTLLFSPTSIRYSLSYAYDWRFVLSHLDLGRSPSRRSTDFATVFKTSRAGFSFDETETFFLKQLFALYRHPPDPAALFENTARHPLLGKSGLQFRREMLDRIARANQANLGGIPNPLVHRVGEEEMEKMSRARAAEYLDRYTPSPTQTGFFKKLLSRLAGEKIRTVIYWPLSPAPYRQEQEKRGLVRGLQNPLKEYLQYLKEQYPGSYFHFVDLEENKEMNCRFFLDPHHLSGRCYRQLTEHLFRPLRRTGR